VSTPRDRTSLRVRVDERADLTWDLGPDDGPDDPGVAPSDHLVHELLAASADRAAGMRRFEVVVDGWAFRVSVEPASRARLRERAALDEVARHHHAPVSVRAPMAGRVVRIWVGEGDTVEAGQRLLAIEAMKMENEVRSPRAGVVESIVVTVDASVEHGDDLVTVR
jgi:biotin carboxyl carrier protein